MSRFWASWWSGDPLNEETPFRWWDTGHRFGVRDTSYVGLIDAESEEALWQLVGQYFPDNERRFISVKPDNWEPSTDRFP